MNIPQGFEKFTIVSGCGVVYHSPINPVGLLIIEMSESDTVNLYIESERDGFKNYDPSDDWIENEEAEDEDYEENESVQNTINVNPNDVSVYKVPHNGTLVLSTVYDGYLLTKNYIGFTEEQAMKDFLSKDNHTRIKI